MREVVDQRRRDFLKKSVLVSAGAAMTAALGPGEIASAEQKPVTPHELSNAEMARQLQEVWEREHFDDLLEDVRKSNQEFVGEDVPLSIIMQYYLSGGLCYYEDLKGILKDYSEKPTDTVEPTDQRPTLLSAVFYPHFFPLTVPNQDETQRAQAYEDRRKEIIERDERGDWNEKVKERIEAASIRPFDILPALDIQYTAVDDKEPKSGGVYYDDGQDFRNRSTVPVLETFFATLNKEFNDAGAMTRLVASYIGKYGAMYDASQGKLLINTYTMDAYRLAYSKALLHEVFGHGSGASMMFGITQNALDIPRGETYDPVDHNKNAWFRYFMTKVPFRDRLYAIDPRLLLQSEAAINRALANLVDTIPEGDETNIFIEPYLNLLFDPEEQNKLVCYKRKGFSGLKELANRGKELFKPHIERKLAKDPNPLTNGQQKEVADIILDYLHNPAAMLRKLRPYLKDHPFNEGLQTLVAQIKGDLWHYLLDLPTQSADAANYCDSVCLSPFARGKMVPLSIENHEFVVEQAMGDPRLEARYAMMKAQMIPYFPYGTEITNDEMLRRTSAIYTAMQETLKDENPELILTPGGAMSENDFYPQGWQGVEGESIVKARKSAVSIWRKYLERNTKASNYSGNDQSLLSLFKILFQDYKFDTQPEKRDNPLNSGIISSLVSKINRQVNSGMELSEEEKNALHILKWMKEADQEFLLFENDTVRGQCKELFRHAYHMLGRALVSYNPETRTREGYEELLALPDNAAFQPHDILEAQPIKIDDPKEKEQVQENLALLNYHISEMKKEGKLDDLYSHFEDAKQVLFKIVYTGPCRDREEMKELATICDWLETYKDTSRFTLLKRMVDAVLLAHCGIPFSKYNRDFLHLLGEQDAQDPEFIKPFFQINV